MAIRKALVTSSFLVTTSKALVSTSKALVPSSVLLFVAYAFRGHALWPYLSNALK